MIDESEDNTRMWICDAELSIVDLAGLKLVVAE